MATEASNRIKYHLLRGEVDLDGDSIKGALMASGFTFDKDAHHNWADVSASELAAGAGYNAGGQALANVAVAEDDANDRAELTADPVVWTASGGSIGPSPGMILYDDTHGSDAIIGYIDFGGNQTATDGGTFTVSSIRLRLG